MSDEREGTIRSVLSEARDQTADVADQVKSAAEDLYGQARDSASQVADAAGRSMKVARYTASSLEDVVSNTIENQPYTAVAIALGAWMASRTHAPPLVRCGPHHKTAIFRQANFGLIKKRGPGQPNFDQAAIASD
jgi:hypothetical protein